MLCCWQLINSLLVNEIQCNLFKAHSTSVKRYALKMLLSSWSLEHCCATGIQAICLKFTKVACSVCAFKKQNLSGVFLQWTLTIQMLQISKPKESWSWVLMNIWYLFSLNGDCYFNIVVCEREIPFASADCKMCWYFIAGRGSCSGSSVQVPKTSSFLLLVPFLLSLIICAVVCLAVHIIQICLRANRKYFSSNGFVNSENQSRAAEDL